MRAELQILNSILGELVPDFWRTLIDQWKKEGRHGISPVDRRYPLDELSKMVTEWLLARNTLQAFNPATPEDRIIFSERDIGISPKALAIWFLTLYRELSLKGASSNSGRRTFITKAAKRCIEGGGSLRDVQQLAGHLSLGTTQRYIEGSSDAKRRIVDLIS